MDRLDHVVGLVGDGVHARGGGGLGQGALQNVGGRARPERTAAEAGVEHLVLETGTAQPEAIALYRSAGYEDVPPFGFYATYDDSVSLGKALARRLQA